MAVVLARSAYIRCPTGLESVGAGAVLLAIAAGIALAGLIAAPLRRIARIAATAGAGDLSVRAAPVVGRGEVGVLAVALDHMLERLERVFKRQRDFVSDASHELRTPLAVLRAQVELLDGDADEQRRHERTQTRPLAKYRGQRPWARDRPCDRRSARWNHPRGVDARRRSHIPRRAPWIQSGAAMNKRSAHRPARGVPSSAR